MHWVEWLGNLGEFVGAIAVVVTLGFLVQQVRQNSRLIRSQIDNNSWTQYAHSLAVLAGSRETSGLLVRGFDGMEELDAGEQMQFACLCLLALNAVEHQFRQREKGKSDVDEAMLWSIADTYLGTAGGRQFWTRYRTNFSGEFIEWVERNLASANVDARAPAVRGSHWPNTPD